MKNINIGGVPEHFNLPWIDVLGTFSAPDFRFQWHPIAEGSGAMKEALKAETLDIAVLLTEAAVAATAKDDHIKIVSTYTRSPLIWGIHVPVASDLASETDIGKHRYAISRYGSGSHLMAVAHAMENGWPAETLQFVEIGTMEGAVQAMSRGEADVFFWERYMTQPYVDSGVFRRIGQFSAPWPAFVICVRGSIWAEAHSSISLLIDTVLAEAARFKEDQQRSIDRIVKTFRLRPDDAKAWLERTQWASEIGIDATALDRARAVLKGAGVIQ